MLNLLTNIEEKNSFQMDALSNPFILGTHLPIIPV